MLADYKSGEYVKFKRNPYYWKLDADGKQLSFFDHGNTIVVPDLNTLTLKFKSNETDYVSVRADDWADLKQGEATGNYKTVDAGTDLEYELSEFQPEYAFQDP